jgi:hypothetical protein
MPDDQTSGTTAPSGAAAGGTSEGGAAPAGTPASGDQGTATPTAAKPDELATLKAENERLAKALDKANGTAGSIKSNLEGRVATLEGELQRERTEKAAAQRALKTSATTDAIVAQVPEPHRAAARRIVQAYGADGLDLAAEDQPATVAAALAQLGKEFPEYLKAPETPRTTTPRLPTIPAIANGQPRVESVGVVKDGKRLL